jgi:hypothetical protein
MEAFAMMDMVAAKNVLLYAVNAKNSGNSTIEKQIIWGEV